MSMHVCYYCRQMKDCKPYEKINPLVDMDVEPSEFFLCDNCAKGVKHIRLMEDDFL